MVIDMETTDLNLVEQYEQGTDLMIDAAVLSTPEFTKATVIEKTKNKVSYFFDVTSQKSISLKSLAISHHVDTPITYTSTNTSILFPTLFDIYSVMIVKINGKQVDVIEDPSVHLLNYFYKSNEQLKKSMANDTFFYDPRDIYKVANYMEGVTTQPEFDEDVIESFIPASSFNKYLSTPLYYITDVLNVTRPININTIEIELYYKYKENEKAVIGNEKSSYAEQIQLIDSRILVWLALNNTLTAFDFISNDDILKEFTHCNMYSLIDNKDADIFDTVKITKKKQYSVYGNLKRKSGTITFTTNNTAAIHFSYLLKNINLPAPYLEDINALELKTKTSTCTSSGKPLSSVFRQVYNKTDSPLTPTTVSKYSFDVARLFLGSQNYIKEELKEPYRCSVNINADNDDVADSVRPVLLIEDVHYIDF